MLKTCDCEFLFTCFCMLYNTLCMLYNTLCVRVSGVVFILNSLIIPGIRVGGRVDVEKHEMYDH